MVNELGLPKHRVILRRLWQVGQRVVHSLVSPQLSHEFHLSEVRDFKDGE